jgi:hypothetical protein
MDKMEAFRRAVAELGDVPPEQLSCLIEQKYGVKIEPQYIPVFRASVQDLERLKRLREGARAAAPPTQGPPQAAASPGVAPA